MTHQTGTIAPMRRRVVISGLGPVSCFGVGIDPLWTALLEGRSGMAPVRAFDAGGMLCRLGAEIPAGFSVRDFVPKTYRKATKVMARDIEIAVAAARAATLDANILTRGFCEDGQTPTYEGARIGCSIGAGLIAAEIPELSAAFVTATNDAGAFDYDKWGAEGINNLTPLWLLKYLPNMLACHVTIVHGAEGPSNTITCAEASGLLSVGESRAVIERSDAELCFSGSAESKISPLGYNRLECAKRLARTDPDADPTSFVRPFDPDAPGSIPGEGGGILLLEEREAARSRNARPYAEILGFGAGQSSIRGDARARSEGLTNAIERALEDAEVAPGEVDAIVPGAQGATEVDDAEAAALREVFADRLPNIPLITLTPNLGSTYAGAGGLALSVAALCLRHQTLPARLHAGRCPDDLDAGPAPTRDARLRRILVCTTALGGQNAAVLLTTPE
ncbi:MAG: beta-ketoacyl-[acyl-carrier-protein] synthase family protein [Phycisphaeraceae bacterium]|nr:MAG: beta-ketoacyl-[acyl-carrier-protein] synthase family protein [Phycisphaeraceae bacterium]